MKKLPIILILITSLLIAFCTSSTSNNSDDGSVNITNPSDGDTIISSQIFIEVKANSNIFEEINFSIDDSILIATDNNPPYKYNWASLYWADGNSHNISVCFAEDAEISDEITVYISEEACRGPNLIQPKDSSKFVVNNFPYEIDFKWTSLPSVQNYFLTVYKVNGDTIGSQVIDTTKTLTIPSDTLLYGLGEYRWKVQAVHSSGYFFSNFSQTYNLTLTNSEKN